MNASYSAYTAFMRAYDNPATAHQEGGVSSHVSSFNTLWAYYNGSMFDKSTYSSTAYGGYRTGAAGWSGYIQQHNLYREIRLIYNPTRRIVEFYAQQVYPGVLSEDGSQLPEGVPLAIPFSKDTDPALKDAIAQFWQWSNWQSLKSVYVRYGAALGSALVELIDDVERGKITAEIVWPGFVTDLELDAAGNIQSYAYQHRAREDNGAVSQFYTYRKEVDKQVVTVYRDDNIVSQDINPFGFVPAVWVKHSDNGALVGSPAIAGSLGKLDELNNLASHIHDQVHKKIGAPMIFWSDATQGSIKNITDTAKRGATDDFSVPYADKESIPFLKGPAGGRVESLTGDLDLSDAALYMEKLLTEIEADHPELSYWQEMRQMSTVTGPAAARLVGDVAGRLIEAQAAYDNACISLFRMAVAMGGFRANQRLLGWENAIANRQQRKFLPFSLNSYELGMLDMAIMPRPLVAATRLEKLQEVQQFWAAINLETDANVPLPFALENDGGWSKEQLAALKKAQQEQEQSNSSSLQANSGAPQLPPGGQPGQELENQNRTSIKERVKVGDATITLGR